MEALPRILMLDKGGVAALRPGRGGELMTTWNQWTSDAPTDDHANLAPLVRSALQ